MLEKSSKMPFVPKVIKDESLVSYLHRLSKVNYHEITWLVKQITSENEVRSYQGYKNQNINIDTGKLSNITEIDKQEFDNLLWNLKSSFTDVNKKLSKFAIRNTMKIFCPLCLAEKQYHRRLWDLSIYTRCHIHNSLLLCRCTYCDRNIKLKAMVNDSCTCGKKLSSNITIECDNSALGILLFHKANKKQDLYDEKSIIEALQNMEIDLFIYLILVLAFNIARIFYQRKTLFSTPNDFSFCDKVVYEAYNIFIDWPNSFHKFLDKFQTLPQKRAVGGLKNYFDGFHLQMSKLSQIPEFRFLTDEYRNYIVNVRNDKYSKDRLFIDNVSIAEASTILKTTKKNISALISAGLIEAKTVYWWRQKLILLDRLSINKYKNYLETNYIQIFNKINIDIAKHKGYITVAEAEKILETSRTTVIKIARDHSFRQGRNILIEKSFIDKLTDLITRSEIFCEDIELINFYYAQRHFIRITKRSVGEYYKFLFESEVQSFINPNRIGFERIYFSKSQFIQKLVTYYT